MQAKAHFKRGNKKEKGTQLQQQETTQNRNVTAPSCNLVDLLDLYHYNLGLTNVICQRELPCVVLCFPTIGLEESFQKQSKHGGWSEQKLS